MNIVIHGSPYTMRDIELLFPGEEVLEVMAVSLPDLLKRLNIYRSTSQAMRAGRKGPIPSGYTELKASKKRTIYIWNPSE